MKIDRISLKARGMRNPDEHIENNFYMYQVKNCPVCGRYFDSTGYEVKEARYYFKHRIFREFRTTYCYLTQEELMRGSK